MHPDATERKPGERPRVHIDYRRPPNRRQTFVQRLVHRSTDVVVTYLDRTPLDRPIVIDDAIALEDGSPAVWFTFPGLWHDIGRFHRTDGSFTGIYANILTPVRFHDATRWETTDLFLDVWLPPGGAPRILDRDEFADALERGWLDAGDAARAREEAEHLVAAAERGDWPPTAVREWTLDRVRERIAHRR